VQHVDERDDQPEPGVPRAPQPAEPEQRALLVLLDAVEGGIETGRRAGQARDQRGGLFQVGALGHLHLEHVAA
jgi:hypothetical protein